MGTCMSKKDQVFQPKTISTKKIVTNEGGANLLLDQWNEKHIEILKNKFQESIQNQKKIKLQGLDKQAFMKVFADLKSFPKLVAESAFRLFDRDRSGYIDFREFCCGLSIICLSSTNEKIRFVFDLFDLDRDGYLNRQELKTLLETSVMSFRKFCKGPGDHIDKMWIEHHIKVIMSESSSHIQNKYPAVSGNQQNNEQRVDFFTFKIWAEKNLNVYHLLNTFELVPSPVKERKTILEILQHYERKHGDTMYALSFRWWDMWKQYTSQHSSTKDQTEYIETMKESMIENQHAPEFIRNFLIAYYEEQKEGDINEVMQRQDFMDYNTHTMKREFSKVRLTPKSEIGAIGFEMGQNQGAMEGLENSLVIDSSRNGRQVGQLNISMKLKEQIASKRSFNYSSYQNRDDQAHANYHSYLKQSVIMQQHDKDSPTNEPQKKDSRFFSQNSVSKKVNKKSKMKQLQAKDIEQSMNPISSQPSVMGDDDNNDLRISQSFKYISIYQVERPPEIDNSDIEGEHPGQLKPNLILHRDFIILPEEAYRYLQQWYGGGPAFPRKVIMNNSIPTIELYPPLITSVLSGRDGHPVPGSARSLFVSIAMKLSEVFLKICESFNYISTKDTRLWFKEGGNEWILIEKQDLDKSLEEFILKDGDVFMVEVKFGEKWPRDAEKKDGNGVERDWKNFEVGDKVDIFDNNEWKIGRIVRIFKDKLKIHLINEHWKNDLLIPKDSGLIERYGQHTLEMHFKNSNQLQNDDIPPEFSGLENIGNTCYMNAVLQPLFHTPLFKEFFNSKAFLNFLTSKKQKDPLKPLNQLLAHAYGELYAETILNNKSIVMPITFKKIVNQELPMFYGNQQHDSQEFLSFFLDKMSEDLNRIEEEERNNEQNQQENPFQPAESKERQQEDEKQQNQSSNNSSLIKANLSPPQSLQIQPLNGGLNSSESANANSQQHQTQHQEQQQISQEQQTANSNIIVIEGKHEIVDGGTGGMKVSHQENSVQNNSVTTNNNQTPLAPQEGQALETPKNIEEATRSQSDQIHDQRRLPQGSSVKMTTNEQIYHSFFQPQIQSQTMRSNKNSPQKDKEQINQLASISNNSNSIQNIQKARIVHSLAPISNFKANIYPLLLDPNISEPERKAIEAWEREMKMQSSAISDLFVGQQGTTVQCQQCRNRTYAFENFYTLSLPLPYNSNAIFYITVMKRSTQFVISPIIKYGIQIDKNAQLRDLMAEVEDLSRLSTSKMMVVEICNNKIYRIYDDFSLNLRSIYRRTNELVVFEYLQRPTDMPIQPKRQLPVRGSQKAFKAMTDIKMGMILDAQDLYGKWYVGIVVDRNFDYDQSQFSVKVHFYEFPERWDEWYKEENLQKLAPFGVYTEEPKDKVLSMPMMHRKIIDNDSTNRIEHQIIGMPFYISIGSWYTWEEAYVEIINQTYRFIRNVRFNGTKSQRSIQEENENISDEEMGEEKSSKLYKYDSSYFSKKMQDVDKKGGPNQQLQNNYIGTGGIIISGSAGGQILLGSRGKNPKGGQNQDSVSTPIAVEKSKSTKDDKMTLGGYNNDLYISKTPNRDVNSSEIQIVMESNLRDKEPIAFKNSKSIGAKSQPASKSQSHRIIKYSKVQKSYNDSIIQTLGNEEHKKDGLSYDGHELKRLPLKVAILDAETHLCVLCLFKNKYTEAKSKDPVTCRGCDMYQSSDKVKWILGCFKRLEICIDWHDPLLYKNPLITSDMTCLKLLQQEKEIKSGIPLNQCLDLYTKKEKIEDYSCDNCKKSTLALVDTKISKAPDILIIHLKRFAYQNGYLEKIEDLVTFPINNLDISNYVSKFKKKTQNHQYDLYAVVNHIMYHTAGGHYTSYVLSEKPVQNNTAATGMNKKNEIWLKCNDSQISRIDKADLISKDAYILFYKRREFTASNIINFTASDL